MVLCTPPVTLVGPERPIFCVGIALLMLDEFVTDCGSFKLCVLVELRLKLLFIVFFSVCAIAWRSILSEVVIKNMKKEIL